MISERRVRAVDCDVEALNGAIPRKGKEMEEAAGKSSEQASGIWNRTAVIKSVSQPIM